MQTGEMRLQGAGSYSRWSLSKSMSVQATWYRWCGLSGGVQGSQPLFYGGAEYLFYIRSSTLDEDCPEWLGQPEEEAVGKY